MPARLKPPPVLVLLLLSPAIGELLSGSSPPVEFFNPVGFVLMVLLYGCGAILVRELKCRWKKGICSVLLLGAAYGILEEGVMVASFFNAGWQDLNQMAVYGRLLGVNWVWAKMLTIFHAVYSITIPIVLVELAYPERKESKWLGNKTLGFVCGLLVIDVIAGFALINTYLKYSPPFAQWLGALIAIIIFAYAAYRVPASWPKNAARVLQRPLVMWLSGLVGAPVFFLGFMLSPTLIPLWPLTMLFGVLLILLCFKFLNRYDWTKPHRKHLFSLVAGALTFFVAFAPLQELDRTRTDNRMGMSLVGLVFFVGLALLGRYVWKQEKKSET